MRPYAMALLLTALCAGAAADDKKDGGGDKAELEKLQGTWVLQAVENGGNKILPQRGLSDNTLLIYKGNSFTTRRGDAVYATGTFKIDASQNPKAIENRHETGRAQGQVYLGIYKVEGDQLTLCWAAPGRPRPTEFVARRGDGNTLNHYKRQAD